MPPCTCDLSRCVPCDAQREAEYRRTFPSSDRMSDVHIINMEIAESDDGRYQLRIGRWRSLWVWASGLVDLEALKAEIEADGEKARLVDSLGEVSP